MSPSYDHTHNIWYFIAQLGLTPTTFKALDPEVQVVLMDVAQRRMGTAQAGTYSEEFKRTTKAINPSIGDKILRHTFTRRGRYQVTAEHFVGEAISCLADLMTDSRYSDRIFTNFVFSFATDENKPHPISIANRDIQKLGVEGCIRELLKLVKGKEHELYQGGSGGDVMEFVDGYNLNTRLFTVTSKKRSGNDKIPSKRRSKSSDEPSEDDYIDGYEADDYKAPKKDALRNSSSGPNCADPTSIKYVGFDFETVIHAEHGYAVPYAFSIMVYDKDNVEEPEKKYTFIDQDPNLVKEELARILALIRPSHKDENVYLIGFNNSNFDNFMLHETAIEYNIAHSQPFIVNSSILGFVVDNVVVRDLRRFVMKSLKEACKDFQCDKQKKTLEHWEVQLEYYKGEAEFKSYLHSKRKKIRSYVERDVASMMELFFKCRQAYLEITGLEIEKYHTLASVAMATFKAGLPKGVWEDRPRLDKDEEEFVRKATYGGRSQVFNLRSHVKSALVQGDVKSLYPYLMKLGLYPLGDAIKTKKYKKGKIGVYQVQILAQPTKKIVAHRGDDGRLNWDKDGEFEACVTNVSLECLDEHGGKYKVLHGVYWERSANIFGDYVDKLYKVKKQQDKYKDKQKKYDEQPEKYKGKKSKYNASLRNIVKLLMNSLSGKMVQRTYYTIVKVLETSDQLKMFRDKIIPDTEIIVHHGSTLYASGDLKEEHIKRNIPVIWGILIYEYSRRYMYDTVYSKMPIYATETDSYTALKKHARRHKKKYPHMYGDELGQIELEFNGDDPDKEIWGIFVAKKVMCLYDHNLWEAYKSRKYLDEDFKAKLFAKDEDDYHDWNLHKLKQKMLEKVMVKHTFKGVKIDADKLVSEEEYRMLSGLEDRFKYYWDNRKGGMITVDTYDELAGGGTIFVMCSQLRRRLKSDNMHIPIAHIAQIFMLKKFPRKQDDEEDVLDDTTMAEEKEDSGESSDYEYQELDDMDDIPAHCINEGLDYDSDDLCIGVDDIPAHYIYDGPEYDSDGEEIKLKKTDEVVVLSEQTEIPSLEPMFKVLDDGCIVLQEIGPETRLVSDVDCHWYQRPLILGNVVDITGLNSHLIIPKMSDNYWSFKRSEFEELVERSAELSPEEYRVLDVVHLWRYGCSIREREEDEVKEGFLLDVRESIARRDLKMESVKLDEERRERISQREERREKEDRRRKKRFAERRLREKSKGKERYDKWKKAIIHEREDDDLATDIGSDWSEGW